MKDGKLTIQFSKKERELISRISDEKNFDKFAKELIIRGCHNQFHKQFQLIGKSK